MGTPSLPAELWRLIASDPCLFKADLARLCTASFHFLHVVRPLLYRTIHLKAVGWKSNSAAALALLAKDKSLARCVVELRLSRRIVSDVEDFLESLVDLLNLPCLVNVDALANMTSLKRIEFSDNVFRNGVEQGEFAGTLADIPLEQLTYQSSGPQEISYGSSRALPGDELKGIGNLKKLVWDDRRDSCAFPYTLVVCFSTECHIFFCLSFTHSMVCASFQHISPHPTAPCIHTESHRPQTNVGHSFTLQNHAPNTLFPI
jgi:hypothetical protein